MVKKIFLITGLFIFLLVKANGQTKPWKFAHISDTHIDGKTTIEDLQRTIKDINANPELDFVVITGDITEFGSDEELMTAKRMFSSLNKPWYVIPGNHDMNWSESGGNSFKKIFGSKTVAFKHKGIQFLGTNCGPNMRMGPGQVPRENLVWLDSVLKQTPKSMPVIFMNHYPLDASLNNWYSVIRRLKTCNTQLVICGHWHQNHQFDFEDIPGIMGRSNLRGADSVGGYNIVTVKDDSVFYNERLPGLVTKPTWATARLCQHDFTERYPRPSYEVNDQFKNVKQVWRVRDNSDIGAGAAITGNLFITANTGGWIRAYDQNSGKVVWSTKTGGKLYSTPCAFGDAVAVASTDDFLYCLDKNTGKVKWKAAAGKPLVASPIIAGNRVFCGSSDGYFRCYKLSSGKLIWDFKQVKGFTETRPLLYRGRIYFGSWGNQFYALDQRTGAMAWKWGDGYKNRMFSAAACEPVAVANRIFIVAPDRFMTCFNASNGKVIWRKRDPKIGVRESMGLSADSSLVYVKTTAGDVLGINAQSGDMQVKWRAGRSMGYDISPSRVEEHDGLVFALSQSGAIYCYKRDDGSLVWIHKLTNCLVNPLSFLNDRKLIATTMDGAISCLSY
ncbi:PQQ-binding-like beta-propeller repeat protein [Mucilaginibacter corticis]|uniref:PQQ-binding-like beta-propeller repeat protein n=1 Tax=Mucilaginibacter corticis TaxID=2597670 RepID=A0A556MLB3_9SPHI|nr:PQQ-binding-like beta-propeller repeat protein [Mucilaginibacter corticis]TSJ40721.1 PQQ-binding-like beta-propeller repeat protein [Mucilaginibacter corticis]